jgi:alkyl sulfatase BDS1-like metallo-beta-lactamase superfamily hydrolase
MKRSSLRDMRGGIETDCPVNPVAGVWMIPSFGNTGAVETKDGLVLVDVPVLPLMPKMIGMLRGVLRSPVHTVFVTHGHGDHAVALDPLFEEAEQNGAPPPRVIAQRNVLRRFNRYRMLAGYHDHINRIQFAVKEGVPGFTSPQRNPDILFDQTLSTCVGGIDFHAYHARGETDDHLWVWVPEKKTVFVGDMVIWSFPNVGNPFKVQRYTLEWAEGLEAIAAKEPEVLVPGHGGVMSGRDQIRAFCLKASGALRYLHDEVVKRLNAGMWYEDILHDVRLPDAMMDSEFLVPRYGCPTFVVHGILRQYTGWYDGNPSNLFPPKRADVAKEVVALTGKDRIVERARELKQEGREAMALQLLDMALAAVVDAEEERELHRLKGELLGRLGDKEPSFIARNILYNGHNEEMKLAGTEE